ncbi:MAG: TIM barrel protein [Candidatus Aenigmarchaeota archaeon]|nr:TIM barrel protein [Candidatus Aenigmarchaeota archaeon]
MNLLFGTAGIPLSTENRNTINGIKQARKLGLDAMELEFVQSVNISMDRAPEVRKAAKENSVTLTCHAPYYINLNSLDSAKLEAGRLRLLNAARIANLCGGWSVAFHPAFYHKMPADKVYENVEKQLSAVMKILKDEGNEIWIRPEVMGRVSQFGTLEEIIKLSQNIENVLPCVDFGHLHARDGKYNTYEEFCSALALLEKELGRYALDNMHIHIEGIEYNDKGERFHKELDDSDMNYRDLAKAWKNFKIGGVVISESPNIEKDAMMLKGIQEDSI